MGDITAFIDAIYDRFEKSIYDAEDDQKLPPKPVLTEVCQELLNVSCMREEGRFPSFRVCFIDPDSELLDTYIYSHVLKFDQPIPFSTRNLHKLAPALNADMSYLMLDITAAPYKIIGIIASYTAWEKIMTRELTSGNRMPRIPNILVSGPGELKACFGEAPIVNYDSGHCVFFRTNTFTSTVVADQLRNGTNVPENERLQLLYRVLWHMTNYGHGGAIFLVPSAESCANYVDIKFRLSSRFLFSHEETRSKLSGKASVKDIVTYADLISKLTCVDGAVILTKDLDLVGFGAEVLIDKMDSVLPEMCFIRWDNTADQTRQFKDYGMRHRAGYRFCHAIDGSVSFIVSQDSTIEACTKHEGKVYVYDNVSFPLI